MTRSKFLAVVLSVAVVAGLSLAVLLFSPPTPAVSHAGYTWKPGCHCGAPKTTTTKGPTATTKRPTTTTKRPTTTTRKVTTTALVDTTTTTVVGTTTTSTETTTTTVGAISASTGVDIVHLYGSPVSQKIMKAARSVVAGLALSSFTQPPYGSGPPGGVPGGDTPAGTEDDGIDTAAPAAAPADTPADAPADDAAAAPAGAADFEMTPPHYYVSPVAILFLLVYATSFVLYRTHSIRVTTHRKVWNLLLLATFLVTGALGIMLAIGISQDPPWLLPRALLFWHVETGVVMSFISFFHLGWHVRYYLSTVTGRKRATRPAPSTSGGRAHVLLPALQAGVDHAASEERPQIG
jgi:hypothetical protein